MALRRSRSAARSPASRVPTRESAKPLRELADGAAHAVVDDDTALDAGVPLGLQEQG